MSRTVPKALLDAVDGTPGRSGDMGGGHSCGGDRSNGGSSSESASGSNSMSGHYRDGGEPQVRERNNQAIKAGEVPKRPESY